MESKSFKILDKYRDNVDPELLKVDRKCLSTFSKDELMKVFEQRILDGAALCRIGAINQIPEYLCRLAHYAIQLDKADAMLAITNSNINTILKSHCLKALGNTDCSFFFSLSQFQAQNLAGLRFIFNISQRL